MEAGDEESASAYAGGQSESRFGTAVAAPEEVALQEYEYEPRGGGRWGFGNGYGHGYRDGGYDAREESTEREREQRTWNPV